jgi:fructosamine-3-kinase
MNDLIVNEISYINFQKYPDYIKRFEVGYGNYVYRVSIGQDIYVIRINADKDAYKNTIYWLDKLKSLELPVPKVIFNGEYNKFSYLILNYIKGDDLGNVYAELSDEEKRAIAIDIVNIQDLVSTLPRNRGYGYLTSYEDKNYKKNWKEVILGHLNRSRHRIKENNIFDSWKIDKVEELLVQYEDYLASIKPIPFLDDLSTKNVLINQGELSGIIDFDWICFGDKIYYVALTNMALISLGYDTKYVDYLMEEMKASEIERKTLTLYTLIFCVDFMAEKGMKFKDEVVEVRKDEVAKLNKIYEELYSLLTVDS